MRVLDAVTGEPVRWLDARPSWPRTWGGLLGLVVRDVRRGEGDPLVFESLPLDVPTELRVEAPGYADARLEALQVERGEPPVTELRLQPLRPLGVRVLAPDGTPCAGAWVAAHEPPRPEAAAGLRTSAFTQADGRVLLASCAAAGERVLLQAWQGQRSSGVLELDAPAPGEDVELRLRDDPPRREVTVRVLDAAGAPVEGTLVRVDPEFRLPDSGAGCAAITDAAGLARFAEVPDGAWRASLPRGPGTAQASLLVAAPAAACELRVE